MPTLLFKFPLKYVQKRSKFSGDGAESASMIVQRNFKDYSETCIDGINCTKTKPG